MPAVATCSMIQREIGDDRVCVLTFDRPESGANIFDAATMSELGEHVDAIERDNSVRGLIITSAKRSIFIAGADLKTLLKQAQTGELRDFIAKGQRVFNRIAGLKIPSVAAVHGACAGGGYEITLACDWRVASDDPATRIGLPETTLGLIPAWGGSTRLPRLIGEDNAAEVILKGKLYSASEALKIGLVDEVASREQLLDAARRLIGKGKRPAAKVSPAKGNIPVPSDPKSAQARALGVITTATANPVDESRAARSRSGQHRKNLRRRGEARFDDGGKSETGPRPHCCFDRADGIARRPVCDRSRFGKDRHQKGNFPRAVDAGWLENDHRDEHLRASSQRVGALHCFPRPRHRFALL